MPHPGQAYIDGVIVLICYLANGRTCRGEILQGGRIKIVSGQIPRDAMHAQPMPSCGVRLSVCLSVCLSPCHIHMNKRIFKIFLPF